jgi:predicted Zn-dependent peptidase
VSQGLEVLDRRPAPGQPRDYRFPPPRRSRLDDGLELVCAHVPGRPLLQAQLLVRGDAGGGASSEEAALAGVTVLLARAMPEGTARRDAVELVEAAERLGAALGADAGWDSLAAYVEVPRARLGPALGLLAEMALEPSFPEREVARLRDERLNDLRQAMADPRRRVERAFAATVYSEASPFARPLAGTEDTVADLDHEALSVRHRQLLRAGACTLIVCGDLDGLPIEELAAASFRSWPAPADAPAPAAGIAAHPGGPRVVVVDRPGAPQSEVRVGHVGLPRRIPDFHAVSVMNTLLGGLFTSRLNRLLREERGYTYGVHSAFDMRRAAGPFAVRCAVESAVTVPAIVDIMSELRRIRETAPDPVELATARDYLVGVFPLRYETSAQVAGALSGLVIHELPDDELDRYRPAISRVDAEAVQAAAAAHLDPDGASVVVVGDAERWVDALRDAGLGEVAIVRDDGDDGGVGGGGREVA